jgi:thiamine-monophosphate kinase
MAARPSGYLLTLALPRGRDDGWVAAFAAGLARDQAEFSIPLLGGDSVSTEGPVTVSITAWGVVDRGKAVLRSGARPGDLVLVSGTIGDGALGLLAATWRLEAIAPAETAWLADRYRLPQPRVALGLALGPVVHAMMDISDGIVADLGHIAMASGVDALLEAARLPLSPAAAAAIADHPALFMSCLSGGDDYELLFTAAPSHLEAIEALAQRVGTAVTVVGRVAARQSAASRVQVIDAGGEPVDVPEPGWRHC